MTGGPWAFTACLRWPDVDATAPLPRGWSWDGTCTSIVNSDATAADPTLAVVQRGGALLTPVAATPSQLAEMTADLWDRLRPGSNYRTHLTVTVHAPGISTDPAGCRRIVAYTRMHLPNLWAAVDPLDGLLRGVDGEAALAYAHAYLDGEIRPLRRELISEPRHRRRLAATTMRGFVGAGIPGPGQPAETVALWWDGTVSMSCFAGARSPGQVGAAALFAQSWVASARGGGDPFATLRPVASLLPRQRPFDPVLEEGWRATNTRFNPPEVVAARLRRRAEGEAEPPVRGRKYARRQ